MVVSLLPAFGHGRNDEKNIAYRFGAWKYTSSMIILDSWKCILMIFVPDAWKRIPMKIIFLDVSLVLVVLW